MATTTTQQYVSEDPRFVAYKEGLLQDSSDFVRDQMGYNQVPMLDAEGNPVLDDQGRPRSEMVAKIDPATGLPTGPTYAPDQFVAGLSTPEQQAISLAQQGIGSYEPFLQRGLDATEAGLQGLTGTAEQFDPTTISQFMNPYEEEAINYAMQDIGRAGEIAKQGGRAQAVGAGAFGGSRSGIMESELGRNILDQQARTAAQMRQSGYQDAATRAQNAFESSKGRGLQGSQLAGNFGQNFAGLGGMAQGALQSDIGSLTSAGALQRGVEQSGLDAMYKNQMQRYQMPYQQYGFLGDIYSGAPSTQQQITSQVSPDPSVGQQIAGLGIAGLSAAAGAQKAGLFG
tara:strand:- start:836 stop:1861 length:1026 start_codon:yes stop_codon:yes gene_type:complete